MYVRTVHTVSTVRGCTGHLYNSNYSESDGGRADIPAQWPASVTAIVHQSLIGRGTRVSKATALYDGDALLHRIVCTVFYL